MDKLKKVLSGQDTEDRSGLSEVRPLQARGEVRTSELLGKAALRFRSRHLWAAARFGSLERGWWGQGRGV